MILSIHIPKTAGTSFGALLQARLGQRLLLDYGDWAGFSSPKAQERRALAAALARDQCVDHSRRYDAIHGHFSADKYRDLFENSRFVAFFRNPYQQTLSNYYYILRNPQIDHPAVWQLHEQKMSLMDFISWNEVGNPQSKILGSIDLEQIDVVGITEKFSEGVALFNATLGYSLPTKRLENLNPDRTDVDYEITPEVEKAIKINRAADWDLYTRAAERFARLATSRGV
jgi:Sulfotransferase family